MVQKQQFVGPFFKSPTCVFVKAIQLNHKNLRSDFIVANGQYELLSVVSDKIIEALRDIAPQTALRWSLTRSVHQAPTPRRNPRRSPV
jgi:hypothetical protein